MDLQLIEKVGYDFTRRRRKWVLLLTALGFTGYGVYMAYRFPSLFKKRKKLLTVLGALFSVAEAVSHSAESIGIVSKDLNEFLKSESNPSPNSLKQILKIYSSEEFSESLTGITGALTTGVLKGYRSEFGLESGFLDRVMNKLCSEPGSGLASSVAGSFARNLVMAFHSIAASNVKNPLRIGRHCPEHSFISNCVDVICSEKIRELIGDCVSLFVNTAVGVYLEKTNHINTFNEMFSALTNPKHEEQMKELVSSVCNGAVETLVKSTQHVLTGCDSETKLNHSYNCLEEEESGWVSRVVSALAVPGNSKFVVDVAGIVRFETFRSVVETLMEKLWDGVRRGIEVVQEVVVAKSSAIVTVCVSFCFHVLGSIWILVPA